MNKFSLTCNECESDEVIVYPNDYHEIIVECQRCCAEECVYQPYIREDTDSTSGVTKMTINEFLTL